MWKQKTLSKQINSRDVIKAVVWFIATLVGGIWFSQFFNYFM